MSKCAYCGGDGPFTREHVFPAWLYKRTTDYDQQFLRKIYGFTDSEIVIRDVCEPCNTKKLKLLDDYVVTLYEKYFQRFVKRDETINFVYDFDLLTRWLLKVSYNSARVHNSDHDELSKLADYILTGSGRPNRLAVFLRLIVPYRLRPGEEKGLPASHQGLKELPPAFIREAPADDSPSKLLFRICRMIGIHSYYFYVLLPRETDISRQEWKEILKVFQSSYRGAERIRPMQSKISIASSEVDGLDVVKDHLIDNMELYQSES